MVPLRPEVHAAAVVQIERFLPAGADPLAPAPDAPIVFRFPSPRGLVAVDQTGELRLALPGTTAAFGGDLATAFAYPWVAEFGVVALLRPAALSPHRVRARPGWYVFDAAQTVPASDCVIVPDQAMAERLTLGMDRAAALSALGAGYAPALERLRGRWREYLEQLPRIDGRVRELEARATRHRDGVQRELAAHGLSLDRLAAPTFELSAAQRAALAGP